MFIDHLYCPWYSVWRDPGTHGISTLLRSFRCNALEDTSLWSTKSALYPDVPPVGKFNGAASLGRMGSWRWQPNDLQAKNACPLVQKNLNQSGTCTAISLQVVWSSIFTVEITDTVKGLRNVTVNYGFSAKSLNAMVGFACSFSPSMPKVCDLLVIDCKPLPEIFFVYSVASEFCVRYWLELWSNRHSCLIWPLWKVSFGSGLAREQTIEAAEVTVFLPLLLWEFLSIMLRRLSFFSTSAHKIVHCNWC